MAGKVHVRVADVRGASRLAVDATLGLTSLVENMHHNILRTPGVLGKPTQQPTRGLTGLVYKSIRGVTRLVGGSVDALLGLLGPKFPEGAPSVQREAALAAINGVLGDHLLASANPLATEMSLRRDGKPLDLTRKALKVAVPDATGRLVVLVHGLCMNDREWRRGNHDHGVALQRDAGFTPVYLHYNSGLHISTNGREFAGLLETLVRAWPVPMVELVIIAHSMGGLVTRSACHYGEVEKHAWLSHLRAIVFLGTPHQGAPLERGGSWVDALLDASPYTSAFARLGKIRSAGITDLRLGSMLHEDWKHRDRFARSQRKPAPVPLPRGVECHAIAASIAKRSGEPFKRHLGDGLVPVASALGRNAKGQRNLSIPPSRRWIGYGMNHLDLLSRRSVYTRIRRWLQPVRR
jgi:pimeloyl-ACP methyl ester carboxylesterase